MNRAAEIALRASTTRKAKPLMKAAFMYAAGDVRVEDAPEPTIQAPTDAIVVADRLLDVVAANV